jgi:hypothetical protein
VQVYSCTAPMTHDRGPSLRSQSSYRSGPIVHFRREDVGSDSSEGTAEQDKRHLDELVPERRQSRIQP